MYNSSKRLFLQSTAISTVALTKASLLASLLSIQDSANAQATPEQEDYKALVCIFLEGGNDNGNTIIPISHHENYTTVRGNVSIPKGNLTNTILNASNSTTIPISNGSSQNVTYALHPNMTCSAAMFNHGYGGANNSVFPLAILLNVGPINQPMNITQYDNGVNATLPENLFSHIDQQHYWQANQCVTIAQPTGWGGRITNISSSVNSNVTNVTMESKRLSGVTIYNNSLYLKNETSEGYHLSTTGVQVIDNTSSGSQMGLFNASPVCQNALISIISATDVTTSAMARQYAIATKKALATSTVVNGILNESSGVVNGNWTNPDKHNNLEMQLKMVANVIAARTTTNLKRQVFMVGISGFDTHDGLSTKHGILLDDVDKAMKKFNDCMVSMNVSNLVTAFTASDFGRAMQPNKDGSDHGWGSHHFIMGGAVKGRQYYGQAPGIYPGHDRDVGQGRLLPSTSLDQYIYTLAKWFGLSDDQIQAIVPNIVNWPDGVGVGKKNLGFMG